MMFVPGNNPGMMQDAYIYHPDSIMLDLEDSVTMAEKDAARLAGHPLMDERIKPFIYVVPVMVKFIEKEELFNLNIINYVRNEYVRQDSRNSSLLKG